MARVTYHVEGDERNIRNASLAPPKRAGELYSWFKAAREALPNIPDPTSGHWLLSNAVATVETIVFELHNDNGERGLVIIDRKAPSLGL